MNENANKPGTVFLIGAGPGDPGLITVKGLSAIQKADVVIYDYLASPHLLAHAGPGAEVLYVGKKGGDHTLSQEGINELIVKKALEGKTVARLKGGDPFIFGRGGEEADVLVERGVPFEVVPGVSSAIAAPAYAGIPLTHREHTSTVAFVTGHEDPTKGRSDIDWQSLAKGIGTLVFLMGVKNLPNIRERLIENGRDPKTPAALVRWGTTTRQKTVTGTLENIVEAAKAAGMKAPAVFVVGGVASCRETLNWFETKPLFGRTIVVTRARAQASDLTKALTELGAEVLETPVIEIVPPEDLGPLDQAIAEVENFDWIGFTSVNAVRVFFERLFAAGKDVRALGRAKIAAIGPVTAERLFDFGIRTDILPKTYRAESVVEAFENEAMAGKRVLLPRAEKARAVLPQELAAMGATVTEVTAYRTVMPKEDAAGLLKKLELSEVDLVTFTSSSTAENFDSLLPQDRKNELLKGVALAAIGPVTAGTMKELGLDPTLEAEDYTIPGLVAAIADFFTRNGS